MEENEPIPGKNDHPPTRTTDLLYDDPTRKTLLSIFLCPLGCSLHLVAQRQVPLPSHLSSSFAPCRPPTTPVASPVRGGAPSQPSIRRFRWTSVCIESNDRHQPSERGKESTRPTPAPVETTSRHVTRGARTRDPADVEEDRRANHAWMLARERMQVAKAHPHASEVLANGRRR